jgi:hypothetical protein
LSRLPQQAITGVFVLVAGLVVLFAVVIAPGERAAPVTATVPATVAPAGDGSPLIQGLDPAVQRVLYSSGLTETLTPDEMAEVPAEVARVLIHYGATLAIPLNAGGER